MAAAVDDRKGNSFHSLKLELSRKNTLQNLSLGVY